MYNGFYNTDLFLEHSYKKKYLRKFITKAISLSYIVKCQTIKNSWTREIDKEITITEIIRKSILRRDSRLSVVDRFIYNHGEIKKEQCEYEICLTYDSTFLYIFVNETSFNKLVKEYGLTLKDW